MKRRRFAAVAALTTAAGGLHVHHHSCMAFSYPTSSEPAISIRRRASGHPVSFSAGDGSRTLKLPPESEAAGESIRQSAKRPITKIRPNPCRSTTSLSAFWARGTDSLPADESRRDGGSSNNSFLKKILPPRHSNSDPSVSFSTARTAAASSASSPSTQTTASQPSPTARYYYVSPASLHEHCPSWTPGSGPIDAEECPLDDSLFVGAYEISEHLERAQGFNGGAGRNNAAKIKNAKDVQQQQEEEQQKAASRLVEEALHGFIHRHALHTVSITLLLLLSFCLCFNPQFPI